MTRGQFALVVSVVILLMGFTIALMLPDWKSAIGLRSDPSMFHSAKRTSPTEPDSSSTLELTSPGKLFRIPNQMASIGKLPAKKFTIRMIWPDWQPLGSGGPAISIKNVLYIVVALDPKKHALVSSKELKLDLSYRRYLPAVRFKEYPGYLVYSHRDRIGTAHYESTRASARTPEGYPVLFHCEKGVGSNGGDWTRCRSRFWILNDILISVLFFGEHVNDGTDIILKSIDLVQALVEESS